MGNIFIQVIMADIENLEEEYAKLVEEKQLELIWHPERREEYKISFSVDNVVRSFYFFRNDPPMSVFYEFTYFYLYMYLIEMKSDWMKYAVKAAICLRQMPVAVRETYLCWYHKGIMEAYGSGKKAEIHRRQYFLYASGEISLSSLDDMIVEVKQSIDGYLAFCIEILSYTVKCADILGEDEFYVWTRDQYELVERTLKEAINLYGELNRCPIPFRSCLYYFQGIYYKKTRRYVLAEQALQRGVELLSKIEISADRNIRIAQNKIKDILKVIQYSNVKGVKVDKIDEIHQLLITDLPLLEPKYIACIELFFHNSIEIDEENECEENEIVAGEFERDGYTFDELYDMAEKGDADAQTVIATCYLSGDGVVQNFRLAFEWMQMAARQGQVQAQCLVGEMYYEGMGTEQDQEKAFEWWMKAAIQGEADAQNYIGWVYDVGLGVESDYTEAFKWFVMAAEQGLAMAQANVGEYYELGKGVPKDLEQAVVWYRKAAELECEEAVEALKRLGR